MPQVPAAAHRSRPQHTAAGATPSGFAQSVTGFHNLNDLAASESSGRSRLVAVLGTLAIGLISTVALGQLMIAQWPTPIDAWKWAIPAMVPTLLAGVGFVIWLCERSDVRTLVQGVVLGGIAASGCVGVGVAWSSETIRERAVGAAMNEAELARKVLEDPASNVATAACLVLADRHENADWRHLLLSTLTLRPELVGPCLAGADDDAKRGLGQSLSDRWTRELVSESASDSGRLCDIAAGLSSLPLERSRLDARLLLCNIASENPEAAACCGEVLAASVAGPDQWVSNLEGMIGVIRHDAMSVGVYAMAFHEQGLSPAQKQLADKVEFTSTPARRVALEFACDSIAHARTATIPHLVASLEGHCEGLDVARVTHGRESWHHICSEALVQVESQGVEPAEAVCASAVELFSETAMAHVQSLVRSSIRPPRDSKVARRIDRGWNIVNKDIPVSNAELRALVPPGVSEEQAQQIMKAYSLSPIEWGGNPLLMAPGH